MDQRETVVSHGSGARTLLGHDQDGKSENETSSRRAELGPLDEVQNVARNRRVGACWRENESDEER